MKKALFGTLMILVTAATAVAFDKPATPGIDELRTKSSAELAAIFAEGTAASIPDGASIGYPVIVARNEFLNRFANFIWGGKVFDKATGTLKNKILGMEVVSAVVSIGYMADYVHQQREIPGIVGVKPVEIDGRRSIIIDYRKSEILAVRPVVDELRKVTSDKYQNLYLGRATMFGKFAIYFILEFPEQK